MGTQHSFRNLFLGLVACIVGIPAAWSATVTTNEAGMDTIFSQTNFGTSTIDIRFNAIEKIVNQDLLTVTTAQELTDLWDLAPDAEPTVNMFFIDVLDYCNGFNAGLVGCADQPGNIMVVESAVAAAGGGIGAELNAHELGHLFGLPHFTPGLMTDAGFGNTNLTVAQVSIILGNTDIIQIDSGTNKRYVQITPILLTPIPATLPLMLGAFAALGWHRKRSRA